MAALPFEPALAAALAPRCFKYFSRLVPFFFIVYFFYGLVMHLRGAIAALRFSQEPGTGTLPFPLPVFCGQRTCRMKRQHRRCQK